MSWVGFLVTTVPYLYNYEHLPFDWPSTFDPAQMSPANTATLIRAVWILGIGLLIASWFRIVTSTIGWVGFTFCMAAAAVSWTDQKQVQLAVIFVAVVLILILVASPRATGKRRSRSRIHPGDYVGELEAKCHGDKEQVERLIKFEQSRMPGLSRNAAAMAATTRLRHDRE